MFIEVIDVAANRRAAAMEFSKKGSFYYRIGQAAYRKGKMTIFIMQNSLL